MKIAFVPFYSQQDKAAGKFRINTDSPVKFYSFMAKKLIAAGHDVSFYVPHANQCVDILPWKASSYAVRCLPKNLPLCNMTRRFHWDTAWMGSLDYDLLITSHEFLSIPLRALKPKMHTIVECGFDPESSFPAANALFPAAWSSASLVHCSNAALAGMVREYVRKHGNATVWPLGFDDSIAMPRNTVRYIDVLFSARASSTNYSNHKIFVDALVGSSYKILMTDQTNYLRANKACPAEWLPEQPLVGDEYVSTLHRCKVIVGLMENGYGGNAFREAVAAGCIPVALNIPEYRALLGVDWPYLCEKHTVAETVHRALTNLWQPVSTDIFNLMWERLSAYSYSNAWNQISLDLQEQFNVEC